MVSSSVPAPHSAVVASLAGSFPGLGVCSVRRSSRAFSGWVCVCSFGSLSVARAFASRAAAAFFGSGSFCVVRRVGRRFRVSVPCLPPRSLVVALRPRFVRVGRFRVRFPGSSAAAAAAVSALRSPLAGLLRGVRSVGFSGSRSPSPAALSALASACAVVPASGCRVSVGCAGGVDLAVRGVFCSSRSLLVFSAAAPRFARAGAVGALALRSAACVRSVAPGRRGLLVVVPSGGCPAGVRPGRSFRGCGSGSWGSAALALGLGRRVVVWLPSGVVPPAWSSFSWSCAGAGWWLCVPAPVPAFASPVQLALF
ncbi:hypothetical protein [Anabaena sp. UHCC 0451]|uniref:hypothetical protein n=1 Tax=Anabaena sp. UHCC 0451 TaxID=2055235 RepID=UPI002B20FD3C|nr:hypothetical protein [Anabaena sp. UHCC 0451]MEA5578639.1 hypothetical protein [Anabaena sp. UHCC 0451]